MAANEKTWRKIRSSVARMKRVLETEKPSPGMREWCYGQWASWIDGLHEMELIDGIDQLALLKEFKHYKKYAPRQ